jgi:8-oxo-dGTP diphosphatase
MTIGVDYIGVTTPFYCNDGKGNFLLHKRSKNCRDEQGHWDPGGGKLEFGQSLEESVLREVKEEYGCKGVVQEVLPAHSVLRKMNGVNTHWVAVPFFILVDRNKVTINEPTKIDEIGWFKLDKLPKPLHTGFAGTFKKYKTYFEKYNSPVTSS